MDRLIYTAMTGARHAFLQQAGVANNLANVSTIGYRAAEHRFRAVPVQGEGLPTRVFTVDASVGDNFEQGPLMTTGRPLDVAIKGAGWIAVEAPDGTEAYTRAGNLKIDANGMLQTTEGLSVLSEGGPIAVPPDNNIAIGADGTVSAIPRFGIPNNVNLLGRIKLVNPPENDLARGNDGLFRTKSGNPLTQDEAVKLSPETLEGSNVNVVESMVDLINIARQFEMHIKMLQTADANANKASQVISINS